MVSRRTVLRFGLDALAVLAVSRIARPARAASSTGISLADDFTTLGTREIIGRTILDSAGAEHTWTQLFPSPVWRRGPKFSTGDPGIVDGKLIRRHATSAMYPGLLVPRVPVHVEADFVYDPKGRGGRSVFVHLCADADGTRTTSERPLHLMVGEKGYAVKAMSTSAGDTTPTGFGTFPDTGSVRYSGGTRLARGVTHTVTLDAVEDTVTITWPAAANTPPVTLTDIRLRQARHPDGGDGRFLVLEDESDAADEPYNGFTAVRIVR